MLQQESGDSELYKLFLNAMKKCDWNLLNPNQVLFPLSEMLEWQSRNLEPIDDLQNKNTYTCLAHFISDKKQESLLLCCLPVAPLEAIAYFSKTHSARCNSIFWPQEREIK